MNGTAAGEQTEAHRRARVLWLTKGLGLGGAERLLLLCAGAVDQARYDVDVAYLLPHKDALAESVRATGVRVRCLSRRARRPRGWVSELIRLLRAETYDIIHTHSPVSAALARLIPVRPRPAYVHTEHSAWTRYRLPSRAVNAWTYGRNDAVFAVSEGVLRSITPPRLGLGAIREATVLYHGIDERLVRSGPDARAEARRLLGLGDVPMVVSVGSLTPKKDQRTLVDAFGAVRREQPDAHLVLIGGGPLEADLEQQVKRLGLEGVVHLLGVRGNVQEVLPAFDVFVLSSRHEGLGLALVEAMAAGVACIGTSVDGIPEVIDEGVNGLLVPPADPDALAASITRLLSDDLLRDRLAEAGSSSALRFSVPAAMERVQRVYEELLQQRSSSSAATS